jgi:hypothetical protein
MKRGSMRSNLPCVGIGLVVLCLTAGCSPKDLQQDIDRTSCENNFKQIALYLQMWASEHGGAFEGAFPETLSELYLDYIGEDDEGKARILFIFVCLSTGHKPGNPERIDEWSDYVYNGGKRWTKKGVPPTLIAYDKVGNHKGGRHELYSDGTVKWKPL